LTHRPPYGREELLQAIRLALGVDEGLAIARDWDGVFRAAVAERCATLAWLRCGTAIAAAAPSQVTAAFRSHYAANAARIRLALVASEAATHALRDASVSPIMLKGPALAVRLYGDAAARVCSDLDWFVPARMRTRVHEVMLREGWAVIEGDGTSETCYGRSHSLGLIYIEVHSSLLHRRYAYLRMPEPSGKLAVVDGVVVNAHDDALLYAYLSVHLAVHRFAPLAWLIDTVELWESLSASGRSDAIRAATLNGIHLYLQWARARGALLRRAALGDTKAADRLGLSNGSRVESHPMWRHIALAPGVGNTARAAWSWIAPEWARGNGRNTLRTTVSRVARHWRDALPTTHKLA
jgi:hypothetical protein